jgi:hypothetical protein
MPLSLRGDKLGPYKLDHAATIKVLPGGKGGKRRSGYTKVDHIRTSSCF